MVDLFGKKALGKKPFPHEERAGVIDDFLVCIMAEGFSEWKVQVGNITGDSQAQKLGLHGADPYLRRLQGPERHHDEKHAGHDPSSLQQRGSPRGGFKASRTR